MKREWLLLLASVVVTLLVAVGLIRLLVPGLLGVRVAVDRRVVQLSEAVPPFYENAFGAVLAPGEGDLINDPIVGHRRRALIAENDPRHRQLNAPFDILGFRNRSVPVVADVVAIGDSQTVGENATVDTNWPGALQARLGDGSGEPAPLVYNMSVDGWGAVQYLAMFDKALRLQPRVVVVAYYTGNDPADALHMAYAFEPWKSLRGLEKRPRSAPSRWPPKPEDMWSVTFPDGLTTRFTPATRLTSNDRRFPGTAEAYRILLETARRMDRAAGEAGVALLFTVIPTKELVYAPKVRRAGTAPPDAYARLVADEAANIAALVEGLRGLGHSAYVDLTGPLQQAALEGAPIYPTSSNGHPRPEGYAVIAAALAPVVERLLPDPPAPGLVLVQKPDSPNRGETFLIRYGGTWRFASRDVYLGSGWPEDPDGVPVRRARDLAHLRYLGAITRPDPERFGPRPVDH